MAALAVTSFADRAEAQINRGDRGDLSRIQQLRDQMPNHFVFVRPGQESMNLVVIGSVIRPGTYEIATGTTLNELFIYAGGPDAVGIRDREMTPQVNIFLSRPTENGRRIIFETTFEAFRNQDVDFPELQDLDMLIVETDPVPPSLWREVLSVGSQLLSIGVSVALIFWRVSEARR